MHCLLSEIITRHLLLVLLSTASLSAREAKAFTVHNQCTLIHENGDDGNSFSVSVPDPENPKRELKRLVVRLYGVDCMETSAREKYSQQRLTVQGFYFGIHHIDKRSHKFKVTTKLGEYATTFTNKALSQPFTVLTRHAPARGKRLGRIYAYVVTAEGADLGMLLVRNGLARVYGRAAVQTEDITPYQYQEELKIQEMLAINEKKGAWRDTDWKVFADERSQYLRQISRLNINRMKKTDSNVSLIAKRSDVNPKIVQALLGWLKNGPYKSEKDISKRLKGVGKVTAEKLSSILMFD